MRNAIWLPLVVLVGCDSRGPVDEHKPFDVPAGLYSELFRESFGDIQVVQCRFTIDEVRIESRWRPSLSIFLSSTGTLGADLQDEKTLRLMSTVSKRDSSKKLFSLHTFGFDDDISDLVKEADPLDEEIVMTLGRAANGNVEYSVGEDKTNSELLQFPDFKPQYWIVVASGISGAIECKSQ